MSTYIINIKLNDETLSALFNGKYSLIVFKGANGPPDLHSTVWFSQRSLGYNTAVSWQARYSGYISKSSNAAGAKIENESYAPMRAGQVAKVLLHNGLSVGEGNLPGFYQISNNTGNPMTCGLMNVDANGISAPICATALPGSFTWSMQPVEKVYLSFSNARTSVGSVWMETTSSGFVVDCTDPGMKGVTVCFDINKGWSCSNKLQVLNCTSVGATENFATFLNSVIHE